MGVVRLVGNILGEGLEEHVWYRVTCMTRRCRNFGPWLVHGPQTHEQFWCAACKREMRVDAVES